MVFDGIAWFDRFYIFNIYNDVWHYPENSHN